MMFCFRIVDITNMSISIAANNQDKVWGYDSHLGKFYAYCFQPYFTLRNDGESEGNV
jgi:hypothetical protein